jgi:hypothetical protein
MLLSRVELCLVLIHTRNFINFDAVLFHSEAQVSSKPHLKFLFIHHRKIKCIFITKPTLLELFKENVTLFSGNLTGKINILRKMQYFNVKSLGTYSHYFASDL